MPEPITIFAIVSACVHAYHLYKSEQHEKTINAHAQALKRSHKRRHSSRTHKRHRKASSSSESNTDSSSSSSSTPSQSG